jgi:alanyl-tRNA synthetase
LEIGNSVFMEYLKTDSGFTHLPKKNVDFGGGLERIAAASLHDPDVFKISLLKPVIEKLEEISSKNYDSHTESMRVIADHLRAATWLAADGVVPSNKEQGYVMRRLMRRAIRFAFDLGVEQNFVEQVVPVIVEVYKADFPEVNKVEETILSVLTKEEKAFRQTLRKGLKEFERMTSDGRLSGEEIFKLYDTYGFPMQLSLEEAAIRDVAVDENWEKYFGSLMFEQIERSKTATKGEFKGGLADHSEITTKYHTATHLMYKALRLVLGDHVIQRGSNITAERLRFDFSHHEKMTPEEIKKVEDIVNENIAKDWPMGWREENTKEALAKGVLGAFGDKYGETVKVYTAGDPDGEWFSMEICGGPHVEHTGQLAEGDKKFKITKEESSSAGIRRIKAVLE